MIGGYLLAILTGLFFGLQGTAGKWLTRRVPVPLLTWGSFAFTLPYLGILLCFQGIPDIRWHSFLWATAASFLVNIFAWYLFFQALQSAPLSHTMPFTAFTPLFIIPVSLLMLGEMPDLKGVLGILLIISGGYGIHLSSGNLLAPLKSLVKYRGTRLMLIVSLIWSISASAEKVAVLSSSQAFYGFTIFLLLTLAYTPLAFRNSRRSVNLLREHLPGLFLFGFISGLMIVFQFTALKYLLVSYVIAFKRAGVIVSVLLGVLLFKEKNPLKNLVCTLLMVCGVFLIMS